MKRFDAMKALGGLVTEEDLFVSATGYLPNDWWNFRPGGVDNTFTVGTLGSVTPTATGLALALPHRRVVAIDADGSMLMNLGVLCTLANLDLPNLTVLVLDNGVYESSGGQRTHTSRRADLARIAEGAGCRNCATVDTVEGLEGEAARMLRDGQFGYLVVKIEPGVHTWPPEKRKPTTNGVEDKFRFIRYVERLEGITVIARSPRPHG